MNKPVRIQLNRIKGFNLQEHSKTLNGLESVVVTRQTKWGNPVKLMNDEIYINANYRRKILDPWVCYGCGDIDDVLYFYCRIVKGMHFYNKDLQYWSDKFRENNIKELRGKNLACWCPLNTKCHADILLNFINYIQL